MRVSDILKNSPLRFAQHAPAMLLGMVLLVLANGGAHAASFNCAANTAPDERTICNTRALNDQDVRMATLYEVLTHLVGMGQRGELLDTQRAWLVERARCGVDVACLKAAYAGRIAVLERDLQVIYSNGPY
ncbi:lysozyme inhibitor LprI family protein [Xanthobacter sp. TB0139]|uniref:lysozyme inhibitor LprI family protein n=1 Tax=Xanthobacter sp. TB0139 TaxID=3459178 RepID=UPI004039EEB5